MKDNGFVTWLAMSANDQTPIGDLARDIDADECWSTEDNESFRLVDLIRHLERRHSITLNPDVWQTLEDAIRAWAYDHE